MTLGNFNRYLPPKARIIAENHPLIWESSQYARHVAPASTASSSILTFDFVSTEDSSNVILYEFYEVEIYRKNDDFSLRSMQKKQSINPAFDKQFTCLSDELVRVRSKVILPSSSWKRVGVFVTRDVLPTIFESFQKKMIWDMLATLKKTLLNDINCLLHVKMLENDAKYLKSKKPPKLAGKLWNFSFSQSRPFVCVGPTPCS